MLKLTRGLVCVLLLTAACGDDDGTDRIDVGPDFDGGPNFDAGPEPGVDAGPRPMDMCGDQRLQSLVYFGTSEPTELPLTPGQILAIGSLNGCTGIFITDEWILTANHCGVRPGREFCVGPFANSPLHCFDVDRAESHPQSDMTVLHVTEPASSAVPELEPVPIMVEPLDESWYGTILEASGYGQQEDGGFGEREFTAEPLVDLRGQNLTIDGEGVRGVCFGDSGGPVMGVAGDGSIRVFGDLSGGDPSCTGQDNYARTDLVVDWIESFTGPTGVPAGGSCGTITSEGRCSNNVALWCDDDMIQREECDRCGWDPSTNGYRCVTGADPCMGLDTTGICDGDTARWCERGEVLERDCAACDETCEPNTSVGGAYCVPDACEGIDYLGECRGDVAFWCQDGMPRSLDCGRRGGRCDFVNDQIGYYCVR